MKVIIILSIVSVSFGSLESGSGYKPGGVGEPTTRQSDRYLPASLPSQLSSISNQGLTPESHYLPTSYQSPSQNVLPNSLYLPTSNIRSSSLPSLSGIRTGISIGSNSLVRGMPSIQYLPSQSPTPQRNPFNSLENPVSITGSTVATTSALDHRISNSLGPANTPLVPSPPTTTSQLHMSAQNSVSSSQYLPALVTTTGKHSDTFIQSAPTPSYLQTKPNQYHQRIDQPSSTSHSNTLPLSPLPSSMGTASPSGIISNTYLTGNKPSGSLSGFSSLSQSNQYTATGQRHSNILPSGNINQPPPGNYYPQNNLKLPLAKYQFEYHVNDQYGNDYSHKETKNDNEITQGVYSVLLPDGRKQIVHYTADQNGFKPTITYEAPEAKGYQY